MSRFFHGALIVLLSLGSARISSACDAVQDMNFLKAIALSKKLNRPLLLAFLGTDWSISSLKLDREVFDQPAFADNSKYNFLLCKLHFYQTQEQTPELLLQNQRLAEKYHIAEYPTVVVLGADGVLLGRLGYRNGGVDKYGAEVNRIIRKSFQSRRD